ncbi:YqhA family protein [Halomonas cerina]|uniref:Putative membrane protein YqhA n=1 Tax=Halomonas cerina TaxID=447424 RepID=A0A839V8J6_9GAMM|nr:YqhA family protein [Halomonas cerina]MBB3188886.1 putative membrane protein YqhA [Halomonas cerina]
MTPESRPNPGKQRGRLERRFEAFLWNSRLMVLLAVVPALLGALALFIIATMDILSVLVDTWRHYLSGGPDIHKSVVTDIIVAIDIYLIALVLMIFGLGVYKLFVSRIEPAEKRELHHPFNVQSLDQLKDKIARVVILAVIIEFFRAVVGISFSSPLDAIYLALSVLALALALYLMALAHRASDE